LWDFGISFGGRTTWGQNPPRKKKGHRERKKGVLHRGHPRNSTTTKGATIGEGPDEKVKCHGQKESKLW